jgi:hypothetical protein
VGFEYKIADSELAKTENALDRSATVTGLYPSYLPGINMTEDRSGDLLADSENILNKLKITL